MSKITTKYNAKRVKLDNGIISRWKAIHKSALTTSNAIQKELLVLIQHYSDYQDVRMINKCVVSEKSGIRANAIKAYLEAFCSVSWGSKEKKFKHRASGKNDVDGAKQAFWATYTKEPKYKSVNIMKQVAALIKRAQTDLSEHKTSTCSTRELKMLEDLHTSFVELDKTDTVPKTTKKKTVSKKETV